MKTSVIILSFSILTFFSPKLLAYGFWDQPNCFVVNGSEQGASPGFLCIDDIEKLSGSTVSVGQRLDAEFNVTNEVGTSLVTSKIPLSVTLIDSFNIGRFARIETIFVEGKSDQFSIKMRFHKGAEGGLPSYPESGGRLIGTQGDQVIARYVWQSPPPGSRPINDCRPGHCR